MVIPDRSAPLRAVFLDVGETLMHPDPTWEHVYADTFAEFGVPVDLEALQVALRSVYRSGGYGFDGTEEPSPSRAIGAWSRWTDTPMPRWTTPSPTLPSAGRTGSAEPGDLARVPDVAICPPAPGRGTPSASL